MTSFPAHLSSLVYQAVNKRVLESVPSYVRNVLDIGLVAEISVRH